MYCLVKANVVTEIRALKILFDVDAKHVASGGIGGSEGAVSLVIMGEEARVRGAIGLLESIKGEKPTKGIRGQCEPCRYACRFAGVPESSLPGWMKRKLLYAD
jgi:hypothetical protein